MREDEYLACADLEKLLAFVCTQLGERQLRLFACACARRVEHLLEDPRSRRLIALTEGYLDGRVSKKQWRQAAREAQQVEEDARQQAGGHYNTEERLHHVLWGRVESSGTAAALALGSAADSARRAAQAGAWAVARAGNLAGFDDPGWRGLWDIHEKQEQEVQVELLRDIAGNPFRPVQLEDTWRKWNDGLVVRLAEGIYEERGWERMPILADALEEAGCAEGVILAHARGPQRHVRGCWLLEALLAKG